MTHLRGITWDHIRGYGPLRAAARIFTQQTGINVSWDIRSLKAFGDYPIELLADKYDLIMFDHPFVGSAFSNKALVPLDEWLSRDFLADQAQHTVGKSHASYEWEGHQWGLATDAAAQISVIREDMFSEYGLPIPSSWDDVLRLGREVKRHFVAMPLAPTDAICSLLTLCAQIGGDDFLSHDKGFRRDVLTDAVQLLVRLVNILHPDSFYMNPIKTLDKMSENDDIFYVPLTFGYSNYSRAGFRKRVLSVTNIPSQSSIPCGGILGGVGIGVSSRSLQKPEAVRFAEFVASGDFQRTVYFCSGGQPGHASAWTDSTVNAQSNNFFQNTLETLQNSYLRPRYAGYNSFQEKAGNYLHDALKTGVTDKEIVVQLSTMVMKI